MAANKVRDRLVRWAKHPVRNLIAQMGRRHCWACGKFAKTVFTPIMTAELIQGHGYSPEWARSFDLREGLRCGSCWSNGRSQQIARTLVELFGGRCRSLAALCEVPAFRSLAIAEINQCALLHRFLVGLPGLRYSEYGSVDPSVPSEDTLDLSYPDGSFDLVLTSDTLEHVPDFGRALAEIRRVLRPGGMHVFTIPVVWDQATTRVRARVEGGELVHKLEPVYHGGALDPRDSLAFYDFGADVLDTVRDSGFDVRLVQDPRNPALRTLVSSRRE